MDAQTERLVILQDLQELRQEMRDPDEVARMEELGFAFGDRDHALEEIDAAIEVLRKEIRPGLLRRFERVAAKYRRPLALLRNGTCYGCFTRFPTSQSEPRAGPDGLPSCPNCGRLMYRM